MTSLHKADLGFWMNLPPGWVPIDPKSGRIPDQVNEFIERRVAEDPRVAEHQGKIKDQIRQALKAARSADLAFGALLATFTPDGLPITASLALTRHHTPDGAEANQVLAEVGQQSGKTAGLFEIPYVGTAVRSEYLDRHQIETPAEPGSGTPAGVATAEVFVVQYYLPMPVSSDVLIATCVTPTLPMREVFSQLFDAIISTFQFVEDDADTGGK